MIQVEKIKKMPDHSIQFYITKEILNLLPDLLSRYEKYKKSDYISKILTILIQKTIQIQTKI